MTTLLYIYLEQVEIVKDSSRWDSLPRQLWFHLFCSEGSSQRTQILSKEHVESADGSTLIYPFRKVVEVRKEQSAKLPKLPKLLRSPGGKEFLRGRRNSANLSTAGSHDEGGDGENSSQLSFWCYLNYDDFNASVICTEKDLEVDGLRLEEGITIFMKAQPFPLVMETCELRGEVAGIYELGELLEKNLPLPESFKLGAGSYGTVYNFLPLPGNPYPRVAMKVNRLNIKNKTQMMNELRLFQRESLIQKTLDHPFIAKIYATIQTTFSYSQAIEYFEGADIHHFFGNVDESEAIYIFRSLLEVIAHMLEKGIVHLDWNGRNVMLFRRDNEPLWPKVLDMGFARFFKRTAPRLQNVAPGTYMYMAPEVLGDLQRGTNSFDATKCDLWSVGIIFLQLLCGSISHNIQNLQDPLECQLFMRGMPVRLAQEYAPLILAKFPGRGRKICDILSGIFQEENQRLTVLQCLDHSLFEKTLSWPEFNHFNLSLMTPFMEGVERYLALPAEMKALWILSTERILAEPGYLRLCESLYLFYTRSVGGYLPNAFMSLPPPEAETKEKKQITSSFREQLKEFIGNKVPGLALSSTNRMTYTELMAAAGLAPDNIVSRCDYIWRKISSPTQQRTNLTYILSALKPLIGNDQTLLEMIEGSLEDLFQGRETNHLTKEEFIPFLQGKVAYFINIA